MAIAQEGTGKHKFVVDVEPCLPTVLIDRNKFGKVIGNLNNTVKYSPNSGNITPTVRFKPYGHGLVVSVIDEGIGIGPDFRDSLFTTFHRAQRPETRGIRWSELGLYIAKEWTKTIGGDIWLKSELNKGATFFVAVPTRDS